MNVLTSISIICLSLTLREIETKPELSNFIKSFVENEWCPAMVVFNGICWKKSIKVKLMRELSKAGIRSSSLLPPRDSYQDTAVLLLTDLDCPRAQEIVENATRHNLHQLPYRWLVLTSSPVDVASSIWDRFLIDSDLVVTEVAGRRYMMTELHKPALTSSVIQTPRGVYDGALTDVRPRRELFRRRRDVMGATIVMTNALVDSNQTSQHLLQEDRLALHEDFLAKNSWTLGKIGFLVLNATPKAIFSEGFGYLYKGKWSGAIKDLNERKADIGTSVAMTRDRLQVVTFMDSLDSSVVRFIFRQPALSYTTNVFSLAFSSGVWIAIALTAVIAAFAFYLTSRWTVNGKLSFVDAILLTMSAVSQQGCELQPRNLSARIVLYVIFTSLMALYAAYGAFIVVLLQAPSSSINNLQQLSKSKLVLGAFDVNYNHYLFKGNMDAVRKVIAKKIDPDSGPKAFFNLTEGVERMRKGLFAFHSVDQPVYRQVEKTFEETEKCDLVEIDFYGVKGFYTPTYRHSPYKELLRVVFKQIREVGIKSAVNLRLGVRKPSCKESVAMFTSVGVVELRQVLLFTVYGVIFSVAVLMLEILVAHIRRYYDEKGQFGKRMTTRRNYMIN